MGQDIELEVMGTVYQELVKLDDEAKQRVLDWVARRLSLTAHKTSVSGIGDKVADIPLHEVTIESFDSVADAFTTASPEIDKDKALVVATFLQQKLEKSELTGYEINSELKHLGHGLSNITDAINQMINRRPQLMIQVRKEGTTKQSKKKYKVTAEGLKVVRQMLNKS